MLIAISLLALLMFIVLTAVRRSRAGPPAPARRHPRAVALGRTGRSAASSSSHACPRSAARRWRANPAPGSAPRRTSSSTDGCSASSREEREQLGRELHDNICQTLYAVSLTLEGIRAKLVGAGDSGAAARPAA